MSDDQIMPSPLFPPMPVLSYEIAAPTKPFWLAKLICGLAIADGAVSAGYVAVSRVPGAMATPFLRSSPPVVGCGLVLVVFGSLGIFRVKGSRLGIAISEILLLLCNWVWQWGYLRVYGPADNSTMSYTFVAFADYAVIPIFVVLCLFREPIKGCFTSKGRSAGLA